jgi:hypothetical protein
MAALAAMSAKMSFFMRDPLNWLIVWLAIPNESRGSQDSKTKPWRPWGLSKKCKWM